MKKYLDKFKEYIYINKNLFVFLLVIVIVGVISGSIFSLIVNAEDKALVSDYLNSFFNNIKDGKLDYNNSITNSLVFSIGFAAMMWLFGISVIGFFLVLFMLFLKSFVLGFSISSIIINFKLKGVFLGLFYVFPHHIINIFVYVLLAAYALVISYRLITVITKKKTLDLRAFMNRYVIILVICVLTLIVTSIYEIYVVPKVLNIIINLFK